MPAKPLTPEQLEDAARLKRIFEARKAEDKSITQESIAAACGWKTQSAAYQYLAGLVPLNLDALIKFSLALDVPITEISPILASKIIAARINAEVRPEQISNDALRIAAAFDKLQNSDQKAAVFAQLRAFGVLD